MAAKGERPIIIIKRRKKGGGGHHGGAWKVAYADFVTALMAFFLVMWLVNAVSKEQRAAIFDYFKNPSMEPGKSPKPAPGSMGPGGASTSPIDLGGGLDSPKSLLSETSGAGAVAVPIEATEAQKLESLMEELRKAVSQSQALEPFKDQLLLDITPEGLRIQIVDAQNRPMFDLGSSRLKDYTTSILTELAGYLNTVPNRVSLSGHTDIRAYPGNSGYSNWELSADRANAARRALQAGGLASDKVSRVVGLASSVLFDKQHPDHPINRRISIVVMTKAAEEAALKSDSRPQQAQASNTETPVEGASPPAEAAPLVPAESPVALSTPVDPAVAHSKAPQPGVHE